MQNNEVLHYFHLVKDMEKNLRRPLLDQASSSSGLQLVQLVFRGIQWRENVAIKVYSRVIEHGEGRETLTTI